MNNTTTVVPASPAVSVPLHWTLRDLCDAGGWKDAQTILKCYQQPDEDLIRGALDDREDPDVGSNRQDNRQEAQS